MCFAKEKCIVILCRKRAENNKDGFLEPDWWFNLAATAICCFLGHFSKSFFIAQNHESEITIIIMIIKSPKQSLGDLLFLLRFLLSLPNNVWRLIVFAPFLIIIIILLSFFPCTMNLSTADLRNYRTEFHETWWSYRCMFLVFIFVVKGVKAIFLGVQRGWGLL